MRRLLVRPTIVARLGMGLLLLGLLACAAEEATPTPTTPSAMPTPTPTAIQVMTERPIAQYIPWAMPANRNALEQTSFQSDIGLVFDRLLHLTFDGEVEPAIATSWEMISPTVWRIKIRDDMVFHDGTPLTAEDVAYSANTALQEKLTAYTKNYPTLAKAEVVDTYTVDLHTSEFLDPDSPAKDVLFAPKLYYMMIVPKDYYASVGGADGFSAAPIGTGPYRWTQWLQDVSWKVERNETDHPFRNANFSEIHATLVQEPATVVAALHSGQIDIAQHRLDPIELEALQNAGLKVEAWPARLYLFYFSPGHACERGWPTCDARVRRAIILAVDGQTYSDTIWRGLAIPLSVPAVPGSLGARPDIPIPYDPAEANQLLDEAGFTRGADGIRFSMQAWAWADGAPNLQSLAIQADLAKVGITWEYELQEFGVYIGHLIKPDEHVEMMGLLGSDGYSNNVTNLTQWCSPDPATTRSYYTNQTVWDMYAEFSANDDPVERDTIMGEIFEILSIDDPCYFFVNQVPETWVLQPYMQGFQPAGGRVYFTWDDIRDTRSTS